uniref:Fused toxin protein-like isoform X1 n=1 Tax=Pogona vitticeps TaxID=103695 RepID=A0A6J0TX03_9SAUR
MRAFLFLLFHYFGWVGGPSRPPGKGYKAPSAELESTPSCLTMKSNGLTFLLVGILALFATMTSAGHKEICLLPKVVGKCLAYMPRYYYNPETKKCEKFIYGGCGGNENNFETWKECHYTCEEKPGTCPKPPKDIVTTCDVKCENDWKCPGKKKCCPYGCKIGCYYPLK